MTASRVERTERILTEVLSGVAPAEQVTVDSNFFTDLGADSLVLAHFCAKIRKRPELSPVSIKDVYGHPTIRSLAGLMTQPEPTLPDAERVPTTASGVPRHVLCGAVQLLCLVAASVVSAMVAVQGLEWVYAGSGVVERYLRLVVVGSAGFLCLSAFPILAKWLLIGRWKSGRLRIWSLPYLRFWIVRTLIRANPLALFVGSPLYVLYLRALGARVGRRAVILSTHIPICTDLLEIGDDAVIRKDSYFLGYRAQGDAIHTGRVTVGKNAVVGEATVLDIDTAVGDRAELSHASSLHADQAIPAGEHWHGSPAQQGDQRSIASVDAARCGGWRRAWYGVTQLLAALLLYVPLSVGGLDLIVTELFAAHPSPGNAVIGSLVLFVGGAVVGLLIVPTIPRLINLAIKPGRIYPLYGLQYAAHRAIARMTNIRFFTHLFGDSSYIVHYLRWLGYRLRPIEQTGSNFGLEVKHDNPYLTSVGAGTMVADGLSVINADYSSTSFRLCHTSIGAQSFLGNYVAYPPNGRTGENCLLATKVMVPTTGDTRSGVGLLGSPSFPIPRTVQRDSSHRIDVDRNRLTAKNRHNAATIALYLLTRWLHIAGLSLLASAAAALYPVAGATGIALAGIVALPVSIGYFALIERATTAFRPLQPQICSIYEPYFWWHERYWKLSTQPPRILDGTPFKSLVWRLLGVRIGRRVFDDGCLVMEKTLVAVGDGCVLNAGSVIQPHSQEDGTFKSDRVVLGAGCTIGIGALVHYGAVLGDGASLTPDAFLMKGEEVPPMSRWGGNPAQDLRNSDDC